MSTFLSIFGMMVGTVGQGADNFSRTGWCSHDKCWFLRDPESNLCVCKFIFFFFWGGVSGWLWCFFFIFHSTDDLRDGQHAYKDMTWTYLDGEVKRSFAPFGTVWILRTPLKHVITWVRQVEMESKRRKRTQDWNILEPCLALRVCFQMQHDPPQTHYFLLSYSRLSSL